MYFADVPCMCFTAEPRTAASSTSAAGVARHRHLKVCCTVRAARVSVNCVAGVRLVLAQDREAVVLHTKLLVHKFVLHVNAIPHVEARNTPFFSGYLSTNMVSVLPREGLEPVHEPPDIHVQVTSKLNTHEHTAVHQLSRAQLSSSSSRRSNSPPRTLRIWPQ